MQKNSSNLLEQSTIQESIKRISGIHSHIKHIPSESEITILQREVAYDIREISRSMMILLVLFFVIPPSLHLHLITIIAGMSISSFTRLVQNSQISINPSKEEQELRRTMVEGAIIPYTKDIFDKILSNSENYNDTQVHDAFLELEEIFTNNGLGLYISEVKSKYKYISARIDPKVS